MYLKTQIQNLIQCSKAQEGQEPYYEVLEYIQFDGTQYYNLGFKSQLGTGYEMGIQFDDLGSAGCGVCGSRDNSSASENNIGSFVGSSTSVVSDYNNSSYTGSRYTVPKTDLSTSNWYDVYNYQTRRGIKLNGAEVGTPNTTTATTAFTTVNDFYLGGYNGFNLAPFKGKIRYFKSVSPALDLIPVLDSQLRPCFYDKISKTFYYHTNSTGSTTPAYKRWNKFDVDYIENTGTAYIPFADITPSATMGMNIEYAYTTLSSAEPAGVIGTYNGDTQRKDTFFVSTSSGYTQKATNSSCGVMVFHRGGNVGTSTATHPTYIEPDKDVWYTATVNWLGDGKINWSSPTDELESDVGANAVKTNELRLFSRCNSGNNTYNNCKSRVRKLQFSDGANIIRSYKPVVWHNSDTTAIATLYDEVYNKMETPNGSLKAYIIPDKELFTQAGAEYDKYLNNNGVVETLEGFAVTDKIPVTPNSIIKLTTGIYYAGSSATGVTNWRFSVYNSSNQQITQYVIAQSKNSNEAETETKTIASNASYIRVSYRYEKPQTEPNATLDLSTLSVKDITTYEVGSNCSATPTAVLGTSNCFDTGIYGNQDMQVKLISYLPSNTQATGQLFGSYDGTEATSKNYTINSTHTSGTAAPIRFNGKVITTPIKKGNTKVSIVDNKLGIWVDNTLHGSWDNPSDFTTTTTLLILKCNNSSNVRENGCCYLLLEENLVPIAEYIPVKNATVTTEYGLYDRVSGTLNTGVGTITFNALS